MATDLPPRVVERSLVASEAILLSDGGTAFAGQIRQLEVALLTTAVRREMEAKPWLPAHLTLTCRG